MPLPQESDRRWVGPCGIVEFAVHSDDKMGEAWKWWNALDRTAKLMLQTLIDRFVKRNDLQSDTALKHLDGPIWELKRGSYRLLLYRADQWLILTNSLMKGGRKDIRNDIEKAERIGERHLQWERSRSRDSRQ